MPRGKYIRTKEHKENISKALKGMKLTDATKEKIRLTMREVWENPEKLEIKRKEMIGKKIHLGFKHSEYTKEKIRQKMLGKVSHKKGRKLSENTKKKIREWHIGRKRPESFGINHSKAMKKVWENNLYREKTIRKILQNLLKRPLKHETILNELLQKYFPNEWLYTGNGAFLIGYKNPDFININGKKICIEIYHDYFKIRDYGSTEEYEKQRSEHFSKYGWSTAFINIKELSNEENIVNKIKFFKG